MVFLLLPLRTIHFILPIGIIAYDFFLFNITFRRAFHSDPTEQAPHPNGKHVYFSALKVGVIYRSKSSSLDISLDFEWLLPNGLCFSTISFHLANDNVFSS